MEPRTPSRSLLPTLLTFAAVGLAIVVGLVGVVVATTTPSAAKSEAQRRAGHHDAAAIEQRPTNKPSDRPTRPADQTPADQTPATPSPQSDRIPAGRCKAGRVSLTFDDGPSPTITPDLIALLKERHVPATFFMVGSRVAQYPEVARAVADAGFAIGNHTYNHEDLSKLSRKEIRSTLKRTRQALRDAGVGKISPFVRPPYGATDADVTTVLRKTHRVMALWNVDSRDWDGLSAAQIRKSTVSQVVARGRSNSIVLHHDGVANSSATLAALPSEIRRLRGEGFCFVPLPSSGLS
ncbi:polysaccharide deacetylase family protein [Nocardioides sp. GXZ039]|uniref:polysaccharide deacetylase family protein n=1 Tax=Nocardioides sp. GXZ039 TaxID=3136018 RepID=UPI0030F43160